LQLYYPAVEEIIRIQQLAEVTLTHCVCGNGPTRRIRKPVIHPFLTPIPEELILRGVELARDVARTADVITVLVIPDRCGAVQSQISWPSSVVASPRIRVKNRVTDV